jgi:hypothetical protein
VRLDRNLLTTVGRVWPCCWRLIIVHSYSVFNLEWWPEGWKCLADSVVDAEFEKKNAKAVAVTSLVSYLEHVAIFNSQPLVVFVSHIPALFTQKLSNEEADPVDFVPREVQSLRPC